MDGLLLLDERRGDEAEGRAGVLLRCLKNQLQVKQTDSDGEVQREPDLTQGNKCSLVLKGCREEDTQHWVNKHGVQSLSVCGGFGVSITRLQYQLGV